MTDNHLVKKSIIQHFGIPDILKDSYKKDVFSYEFEDTKIPGAKFEEYHCREGSVKFALVNETKGETIFTMDFFKPTNARAFGNYGTYRLELIYIHDFSLRRQGIGTYYVNKLKEYMLKNEGKTLSVIANPYADVFKSDEHIGPNKEELVKFYKSFEDKNFEVNILWFYNAIERAD